MPGRLMIGEQVDLTDGVQSGGQSPQGLKIFFGVVQAGDDGNAQPDVVVYSLERAQIIDDQRVGNARQSRVLFIVENLEIVENQILRAAIARICSVGAKPQVSTAVCMPSAVQADNRASRNAGCASGSPPEKVTPPCESS